MPTPRRSADQPPPLGATLSEQGADFAFCATQADRVELCLFDAGDSTGAGERRIPLARAAQGTWFGFVPGVRAGQRYGVRAHGPWQPERGLRHNAAKLLLDPYAHAVEGEVTWRPEVFGHVVDNLFHGDARVRDERDSAPYVPRSVIVEDRFDWGTDQPPHVPWHETVIYEAHVRGLTRGHPDVPPPLRGTYAGMAHPAVLAHLTALGVTSVELLPVHSFVHEPALVQRGLSDYWGYNTLGFLAPHAAYASVTDPQGALDEVKAMVKAMHAAGLEVLLDVVYNHTAEQGVHEGATLSLRGLDNSAYYRLDATGRDVNVTGCGNTLDLCHPVAVRLVLDSLRRWVSEVHVDGFRFDLAVALARGRDGGYDPDHPFLLALRTDPVLSRVKLIAEPWDIGPDGWRTGEFPAPFSEWNDRFRDDVRTFWLPDVARDARGLPGAGVRQLATRLAGSDDIFGPHDRGPMAAVNYVACHDGFTAADTTSYDRKHNEANGEHNTDGAADNRSWNHGTEGLSDDPAVLAARQRAIRNLLATTLLATGVPMLCAGDEVGRTQRGNNNAYCQDNEISWLDWDLEPWQRELLDTTAFLVALRADHPVLRQRCSFTEHPLREDGTALQHWYAADGAPMHDGLWNDPCTRTLALHLDGSHLHADSLLLVFHGGSAPAAVTLPAIAGVAAYELLWDSALARPGGVPQQRHPPGGSAPVTGTSLHIYRADPPPVRR